MLNTRKIERKSITKKEKYLNMDKVENIHIHSPDTFSWCQKKNKKKKKKNLILIIIPLFSLSTETRKTKERDHNYVNIITKSPHSVQRDLPEGPSTAAAVEQRSGFDPAQIVKRVRV